MAGITPVLRRAMARLALRVVADVVRPRPPPALPVSTMGLRFVNPLGLAAGFDRDGALLAALEVSGFGFIEIGTVRTVGMLHDVLTNLGRHRGRTLVGINLASDGDEGWADAADGYRALMRGAWNAADFLVANLSGPRGRPRRPESLESAVVALCTEHAALAREGGRRTPLVVKFALDPTSLRLLGRLRTSGVDAVIGVSAEVDVVATAARALAPVPLVSVGGIRDSADIAARFAGGAALVQVHTAFVRGGPFYPRRVLADLAKGVTMQQVAAARTGCDEMSVSREDEVRPRAG
jgi:dihydroorotate dehydrogenase